MKLSTVATYFDGKSPVARTAEVSITVTGLRLVSESKTLDWLRADVSATRTKRTLHLEHLPSLASLVIEDDAFIRTLDGKVFDPVRTGGSVPGGWGKQDRSKKIIGVTLVAIVGLVLLFPYLASLSIAVLPYSVDVWVGDYADRGFEGKVCAMPAPQSALGSLVAPLTAKMDNTFSIRVQVVREPLVNAIALPNGKVYVFSGLLNRLNRPEQLAGILAHEIQHVVRRHSTQSIVQHLGSSFVLGAFVSGYANLGEFASVLATSQYSRSKETEADTLGMKLMIDAGIDPAGMVEAFQTLRESEAYSPAVVQYISSHPNTADRIEQLRRQLPKKAKPYRPVLTAGQWQSLKEICD